MSLFDEDIPQRPEIVEGLFREGQIVTIAGAYNVGKTPLLAHLATCVSKGIAWCGRNTNQRHVIHVDYESAGSDFIRAYRNISQANNTEYPRTPVEVDAYLLNADYKTPNTQTLFKVKTIKTADEFLRERLKRHPESLIIIDPVEMFFPELNLVKPGHALEMVKFWRALFSTFPKSAAACSNNLRKLDTRMNRPDLIRDPHGWLREISGSNNLLNRSDVRIGMDRNEETDVRVLNGIRRGEDMQPILMVPVEVDDDPEELGGFKMVAGSTGDMKKVLGDTMFRYYLKLPEQFRFIEVANNGVPKSSLHRVLKKAQSLGYIVNNNGLWVKIINPAHVHVEPAADFDCN